MPYGAIHIHFKNTKVLCFYECSMYVANVVNTEKKTIHKKFYDKV